MADVVALSVAAVSMVASDALSIQLGDVVTLV
jgi:hypothetical protein